MPDIFAVSPSAVVVSAVDGGTMLLSAAFWAVKTCMKEGRQRAKVRKRHRKTETDGTAGTKNVEGSLKSGEINKDPPEKIFCQAVCDVHYEGVENTRNTSPSIITNRSLKKC